MHRRSFLTNAALLPAWIAAVARAQDSEGPRERRSALRGAWKEAQRTGRPLLILVIPPLERDQERFSWSPVSQPETWRDRGLAWAQVFQAGSDEVLADLSLCVLACATVEDPRRALPKRAGATSVESDDHLALLVEPDYRGTEPVELAVQRIPFPAWDEEPTPEAAVARYELEVRKQTAAIGAALHGVLAPDAAALAHRAARARDAVSRVPDPVLSAQPDAALHDLAERAPAVVREAAEESPYRAETLALLAGIARANALAGPPAGAYWGESTGCGVKIEGLVDETLMIGCGMGHVPELGRRFLHFYTRP